MESRSLATIDTNARLPRDRERHNSVPSISNSTNGRPSKRGKRMSVVQAVYNPLIMRTTAGSGPGRRLAAGPNTTVTLPGRARSLACRRSTGELPPPPVIHVPQNQPLTLPSSPKKTPCCRHRDHTKQPSHSQVRAAQSRLGGCAQFTSPSPRTTTLLRLRGSSQVRDLELYDRPVINI